MFVFQVVGKQHRKFQLRNWSVPTEAGLLARECLFSNCSVGHLDSTLREVGFLQSLTWAHTAQILDDSRETRLFFELDGEAGEKLLDTPRT